MAFSCGQRIHNTCRERLVEGHNTLFGRSILNVAWILLVLARIFRRRDIERAANQPRPDQRRQLRSWNLRHEVLILVPERVIHFQEHQPPPCLASIF